MSELMGKILTGVITAVATLGVCLINNYVQLKRDRESRNELHQQQLDQIKQEYSQQIAEMKTDFYAKFQELQSLVQGFVTENKHAYDMIKMEIKLLSERQQQYNNLQIRTYDIEKDLEVHEEKIKVANNRINDLERKLP